MLPIQQRKEASIDKISELTKHGLHPILAKCLVQRNVTDHNIALLQQKILPYKELKGIKDMAIGIAKAIVNKEKIVVVADYDCDGATACAIAVSGLASLGANIDFVVPNRLIHGYGLTPSVVDVAKEKNPKWIITVDNGIASIEGIERANELGIGVWVTDHHLPGEKLPNAKAIVNPNQPGCNFISKNLAGCGVMFYVLAATKDCLKVIGDDKTKELAQKMDISDWLDLVALGTIADVVKLDDNNRWLVNQGLIRIRLGYMRPGIAALFNISGKDYERATSQDFGFNLGPRLNAAGRLDDMSIGIKCLLSNDFDEALKLAEQLDILNIERKAIEGEMKETAIASVLVEKQKNNFTRVIFGEDFHEGVIGIVAGRIKEQDYAPTIVFAKSKDSEDNAIWKGSARSIPSIHLRDAIDEVYKSNPEWFLKFGGHAMAAGLSIYDFAKDKFAIEFEKVIKRLLNNQKPKQFLLVDGVLKSKDINIDTAHALSQYVWGQGFEEPVWVGEFQVIKSFLIGKDKNHLKLHVAPIDGNTVHSALHFFVNENIPNEGDIIRIAYKLQAGVFQNEECLDLMIVDRD